MTGMRYSLFSWLIVTISVWLSSFSSAHAQLKGTISSADFNPISIAIADFISNDSIGLKIAAVVAADLERSGLFYH